VREKRAGEMETVAYDSVGINSVPAKNRPINRPINVARKQTRYQAYKGFLFEVLCV